MDFFNDQRLAHRNTWKFIILFIIGMTIPPIGGTLFVQYMNSVLFGEPVTHFSFYIYKILSMGNLVIIFPSSLYHLFIYRKDFTRIMKDFNGRLVHKLQPQTFQELQLIHVVTEISLAANVRPPKLYILDKETSINAFATGLNETNIAIAITKGALDYLTKEEMMALIGHETSHILNKDIKINLYFASILIGMYYVAITSIVCIYGMITLLFTKQKQGMSIDEQSSGLSILLIIGIICLPFSIVGILLALWGNIMQASISRQREYLADASSVQFTRMPYAMASLLKKIGGCEEGSSIENNKSFACSHMFFAPSAPQIFSSHPSLKKRILRLEPNWDGKYIVPKKIIYNSINLHVKPSINLKTELNTQKTKIFDPFI